MLKRFILCFTFITVTLLSSITAFAYSQIFDKTNLDSGLISINYKVKENIQTKIMVKKGEIKYFYDLTNNTNFPLQSGNGEYTIAVLEQAQGKKYKVVASEKVSLQLKNSNDVFLKSVQMINWDQNMNAMKKAKELTKNSKNDKEKVTAIYNYIINNISYDYDKAKKVSIGYLPSTENTFKSSKGICYDYASLFASMLRSVDIPTKLVMGNKDDITSYHSWNQIYLKETNKWITIDTTYDASLLKNNGSYSMIKNDKSYTIDKVF